MTKFLLIIFYIDKIYFIIWRNIFVYLKYIKADKKNNINKYINNNIHNNYNNM